MNGVQTIMEKAALLMLCDNRKSFPPMDMVASGANIDPNSVIALPDKRDLLRRSAKEHEVQLQGEVIIELNKDSDMEDVLNAAVEQLSECDIQLVISLDREGLSEAGFFTALVMRLKALGIEFVSIE